MLARNILPSYLDKPYTGRASKQVDVIVSLTSFPKRIGEVWQVVECLKRQTLRPEKIILWLAKNQFPREDSVPLSLRSRLDSLFEIRFVEEDIRSHKKYYYAFQEYPEKLILLVDDDIYYSPRMIEELYDSYISQSGKRVICSYGSIIKYNQDGIRLPYSQWTPANSKNNHSGLFFGSGRNIEIGDDSGIGANTQIPSDTIIGNNVMLSRRCFILHRNHSFDSIDVPIVEQGFKETKQTIIGDDCWIGMNSLLTPGRKISKGTIVAMGSVFTKDFPAYSVVGGNPAKLIKSRINEENCNHL